MLPEERQRIIVEKTNRLGQVFVSEVAEEFGVSDETIRRDISMLSSQNKLKKVHGGAVPIKQNLHEENYMKRADINKKAKEKIGKFASRFICDNDIIAIDNGTTTDELAQAIYGVQNLTIILGSISALNILVQKRNAGDFTGQIIFLGGIVVSENYYTQGSITLQQLEKLNIDKAFVSCTSVSVDGAKAFHVEDAVYTLALIEKSNYTYLLATSEKFNKESLYKICSLEKINSIVSDSENEISEDLNGVFNLSDIELHIVL